MVNKGAMVKRLVSSLAALLIVSLLVDPGSKLRLISQLFLIIVLSDNSRVANRERSSCIVECARVSCTLRVHACASMKHDEEGDASWIELRIRPQS